MKIRTGFVSNSSSSSFTIISRKPITKEMLWEVLKLPESHPLYNMAKDICACVVRSAEHPSRDELKDLKADAKDGCPDAQNILKKIDEGFKVYKGWFSDEGDTVEAFLCMNGLNIETDEFSVKCEGGY